MKNNTYEEKNDDDNDDDDDVGAELDVIHLALRVTRLCGELGYKPLPPLLSYLLSSH